MLLPRSAVVLSIAAGLSLGTPMQGQTSGGAHVDAIRFWSFGDITRIAIETEGDYHFTFDRVDNPARVFFDLGGLKPPSTVHHGMQTIQVGDSRVKQIRVAEVVPGTTRIVLDVLVPVDIVSSQLVNPDRLMIEIRPKNPDTSVAQHISKSLTGAQRVNLALPALDTDRDIPAPQTPVLKPVSTVVERPAIPLTPLTDMASRSPKPVLDLPPATVMAPATSTDNDPSLVRVLGLKLGRVVIDAGHGGKDTGTIGHSGLLEKDLVLDVALRLGKLIRQQLGAEVIYTRPDDSFIPLGERTAIANRVRADLFISIHANSSTDSSATGVETYYFNLHGDKTALDVAMRENAAADSAISDLNDLLKKAVLQTKLEESREFAQKVQESLTENSIRMNSRTRDRGVRRAPFVVLIGASMPSILAEIGFVSNPHDEKLLRHTEQRDKIAQALLKGVTDYANTLSHPQLARAGGGSN